MWLRSGKKVYIPTKTRNQKSTIWNIICKLNQIYFSETKVRGILLALSTISTTVAPLIIFVLANLIPWRKIALYWSIVQAIATAALFCVSNLFICIWWIRALFYVVRLITDPRVAALFDIEEAGKVCNAFITMVTWMGFWRCGSKWIREFETTQWFIQFVWIV